MICQLFTSRIPFSWHGYLYIDKNDSNIMCRRESTNALWPWYWILLSMNNVFLKCVSSRRKLTSQLKRHANTTRCLQLCCAVVTFTLLTCKYTTRSIHFRNTLRWTYTLLRKPEFELLECICLSVYLYAKLFVGLIVFVLILLGHIWWSPMNEWTNSLTIIICVSIGLLGQRHDEALM